jgi:hypothetical protein
MKRQWQIKRTVKELEAGQKRWDRAYLLLLEMARSVEQNQAALETEANHASSDLCACLDPTPSSGADH